MERRLRGLLYLLLLGAAQSRAAPCDSMNLPEEIRASLATDYPGWKIVTPSMLESSDRRTWFESYSKECPGLIMGKFVDDVDGYVLNLVKKEGGKTFQQIVFFRQSEGSFTSLVIFPRGEIDIVTVIRKFHPGHYKPANGGKPLSIKTDTIGLSQLEAWTEVYYWDGTRFRRLVTSE